MQKQTNKQTNLHTDITDKSKKPGTCYPAPVFYPPFDTT